jgi:soluble lytic murein transglycosylase-like protein
MYFTARRGRPALFDQDQIENRGESRLRATIGEDPRRLSPGSPYSWDGVATPGEIGRPGDLPVPVGQQLRRWGALLALAGLALPGVSGARPAVGGPPAVAVVEASRTGRPAGSVVSRDGAGFTGGDVASVGAGGDLPSGDAWDAAARATAAPWEAGVVEADGKPLPTAPPPGPVPVDGIPRAASAAPPTTGTASPPAAAAKANPAPGETVRSAPDQSVGSSAGRKNDLVPADREYLRPLLIRYAQENGLSADLVMALAWVESSWRKNAVSDVGAVGVMQLMPNTVEFVSKKLLGLRSTLDPRNPTSNVRMGARYLRHLLNQNHGSVRQALIAYNQGLTSLRTNGSYNIAERYADRVLALRPQFRSA